MCRPTSTSVALVLVALSLAGFGPGLTPAAQADSVPEITLPIQVDFIDSVTWTDTWGATRSGGRSHVGVDMLGPKMTPLVAAADGVITWMRHDSARGNILYLTDDDGWKYIYIHINNDTPGTDDGANRFEEAFAPGIERGSRVKAGQVIAYMGDSGNAEWTAPHLHFEVVDPSGRNVNPAPIVDAARVRAVRAVPEVDPSLVAPFESFESFADGLYQTAHGRQPDSAELQSLAASLTADGLSASLATVITPTSPAASLDRIYEAYFLRPADTAGFNYWMDRYRSGATLGAIADQFARSREFESRYGEAPFSDFLDQLYVDVLGREPDAAGKAYWLDLLQRGRVTRGTIVVYFTQSDEMINRTRERGELTVLSLLFTDETPSLQQTEDWENLRSSTDLKASVRAFYL